jgi:hypothetical protein
MAFDAWHYVPLLARNPRLLRNGATFKDGAMLASLNAPGASSPARPKRPKDGLDADFRLRAARSLTLRPHVAAQAGH